MELNIYNTHTLTNSNGKTMKFEIRDGKLMVDIELGSFEVISCDKHVGHIEFKNDQKSLKTKLTSVDFNNIHPLFKTVQKPNRNLVILGSKGREGEKGYREYLKNRESLKLGSTFTEIIGGKHVECCYQYTK